MKKKMMMMDAEEARILLGFLPNSRPSLSQVKEAYKKKVWETHPDRFPTHEKGRAECRFKLISEAYTRLQSGVKLEGAAAGRVLISQRNWLLMLSDVMSHIIVVIGTYYSRVVKTGVPRTQGGRKYHAFIGVPFLFLVLGTVALGGSNAIRAYRRQKEAHPSHNPFLP